MANYLDKIIINPNEDYLKIGQGFEGSVYKYNDQLAFKIFKTTNQLNLVSKFAKIDLLKQFNDSNACFPLGVITNEDQEKIGYFYDLVKTNKQKKDFTSLEYLKDSRKKIEYLIIADAAMQRFHQMGLVLGDINPSNIMIDIKDNIRFIDTDNWSYQNYGFDAMATRMNWLNRIYKRNFALIDSDRFVYAIMALQFFIKGDAIIYHKSDEHFKEMIRLMNVSSEVKEGLRLILSDHPDKPYIGPLLAKINPEEEILSAQAISRIRQIF